MIMEEYSKRNKNSFYMFISKSIDFGLVIPVTNQSN